MIPFPDACTHLLLHEERAERLRALARRGAVPRPVRRWWPWVRATQPVPAPAGPVPPRPAEAVAP